MKNDAADRENYFVIRWLLKDGSPDARLVDVCEYGRLHRSLFGDNQVQKESVLTEVDAFLDRLRDHMRMHYTAGNGNGSLAGRIEGCKVLEYRILRRDCDRLDAVVIQEELSIFRNFASTGGLDQIWLS